MVATLSVPQSFAGRVNLTVQSTRFKIAWHVTVWVKSVNQPEECVDVSSHECQRQRRGEARRHQVQQGGLRVLEHVHHEDSRQETHYVRRECRPEHTLYCLKELYYYLIIAMNMEFFARSSP